MSAREPSSLEGFGHLAFLEYDYRVKAVPASKGGEYVIEAGTRKRWDSVMTFRTDDFWFAACACSSLDKLEADRAGSAGPAVPFISSPMFNPAIIFPAVRATMENPLFFATERGSPMAKTVAVQLVEPLPGGLHIVIQERNEYAIHTHEMLWRRGAPWWSKARSWSVGLIEDLPGDKPQVWLEWEAHLELPDDDAAPMVWPWEPAHWKWPIPEHYP
ncbi:MAG: hypothetical protein U0359_33655 [Byssovorax sp.]